MPHVVHANSAGPRWGAVIGPACFHSDIWAFLGLGFLTPLCLFSLARVSCFKCRRRSEGFSLHVCDEGQSHDEECVSYYSLNSRLKEERLTWWKPGPILRGMGQSAVWVASFLREETEQNIQYNLICEHNFEAAFDITERALSHCVPLLHSQPRRVKLNRGLAWRQYRFPKFYMSCSHRHFIPMSQQQTHWDVCFFFFFFKCLFFN